jgi:hypothetical protein
MQQQHSSLVDNLPGTILDKGRIYMACECAASAALLLFSVKDKVTLCLLRSTCHMTAWTHCAGNSPELPVMVLT